MDPWDTIGLAAKDRRSGAAEIAVTAARGLGELTTRREVIRAAKKLLKAHPAMAPLWLMLADALDDRGGVWGWPDRLHAESQAVADGARWVLPRRSVVLTHSSSSSVLAALMTSRKKVASIICTESRPGGEGKRFAARLTRVGFVTSVVADSEVVRAAADADISLVGADAVTLDGVVNKVGTTSLALACREAHTPLYVLAGTSKFVPSVPPSAIFDVTPLSLIDGIVSERGTLNAAAARRIIRRIQIPEALSGSFA